MTKHTSLDETISESDIPDKICDEVRRREPFSCVWLYHKKGNYWGTQCGNKFTFTTNKRPFDHEYHFCNFCGGHLLEMNDVE